MSALINNNAEMNEVAKMIYYSNSINFVDLEMRKKCRVTNKFFEFLQGDLANQIDIEVNEDDQVCMHIVEKKINLHLKDNFETVMTHLNLAKYQEQMLY